MSFGLRCPICKQMFDRPTSTLPNFCDDCLANGYVKFETVKLSKSEELQYYIDIIQACAEEIDKCRKTIKENEELIAFATKKIGEQSHETMG